MSVLRKSGEGIKGSWSSKRPAPEGLNSAWPQAAHPGDLRSREDGRRTQERRAAPAQRWSFGQAAKPARNCRQVVRSNGDRLLPCAASRGQAASGAAGAAARRPSVAAAAGAGSKRILRQAGPPESRRQAARLCETAGGKPFVRTYVPPEMGTLDTTNARRVTDSRNNRRRPNPVPALWQKKGTAKAHNCYLTSDSASRSGSHDRGRRSCFHPAVL